MYHKGYAYIQGIACHVMLAEGEHCMFSGISMGMIYLYTH